jgi:hypothetical protein
MYYGRIASFGPGAAFVAGGLNSVAFLGNPGGPVELNPQPLPPRYSFFWGV